MLAKFALALMFFVLKKAATAAVVGCVLGTIAWWSFPVEFWKASSLLMNASGLLDFEHWSVWPNDLIEQALHHVPQGELPAGSDLETELPKKILEIKESLSQSLSNQTGD